MEHGFKYITFYVKKKQPTKQTNKKNPHKAPLAICYNIPLVRDKPLGALAFMRLVYLCKISRQKPNRKPASGPFY